MLVHRAIAALILSVIVTPAGAYTPTNNASTFSSELSVSEIAAQIQSLIDVTTPDFASAKALYDGSALQTLALADYSGDVDYDTFKAYYGGDAFHDSYLAQCWVGDGLWSDKTLARVECIEKTTADAIPFMSMLVNLNAALTDAMAGRTADGQAALYVDKAFALYMGGDNTTSIFARAIKRADNYETARGVLLSSAGVAPINTAIESGFVALQAAVLAGPTFNLSAARAAKQIIVSQAQLIYQMGALRYADRLDADYEAGNIGTASMYKSQGEGLTFWRTIAPLVASSAPTGAALVSRLYDLARSPSTSANFCEVRAALRLALPAGITRDDMGELVGTIYHGKVCANYAPVNSVLDDARVSVTVSTIKAALVRVNFVAAKAAYIGSHLEALALTSSAGSAYADHFGEPTPYNSFFIQCVDGTGVWAGKISARLECVEKITFDAVPVQQIVLLLQKALVEATAGHRGLAQAALLVDRAYALYRGGDDLYSPFERANKRGANFYGEDDTKLVDDQLIALNNGRIEAGFVGLQAAVLLVGADYNAVAAAALEMTIVGQLQVTYVQATLRYAAQLDEQVVDGDSHLAMYENQGEGWTFWRVVSPLIALRDAAAAQLIVDRFDLDTKPTRTDFYCLALHTLVLNNLPPGVTAAHVGTLENAHGPTAPDFFRCSTYQITSTPASQLNAVQLMGELMDLLPDAVDTSNWAPLRAAYVGSDLQALALADYDGEARYDAYEALYGDAWIDATILAAADGTGTFTDPSVRAEIFEKSVLDAVSVKELYHLLDKAVVDMDTDFVDAAWALYTGSAGHPLGASVFERAQKRGANYKAAGGAYLLDADGVATTNVAVLAYLESLQTAVIAHNATAAGIAQAGIESQLFVIYYQCTLRYALLLDQDNLASPQLPFAEHQGEGWAFYKTISPIIVAADAAGAATVETLYVVTGARPAGVRNYCSVKAVLDGCWPAGMIAADFGTLEDVPAGHCGTTGGGGSGGDDDGGNDSSSSDSDDDDDDDDDEATGAQNSATAAASIGGGVVAGIVIAVLVSALLVGGLLYFYNRRLKSKSQARYDDQPPPKHTAPSDTPAYYQNTHEVMVVQV